MGRSTRSVVVPFKVEAFATDYFGRGDCPDWIGDGDEDNGKLGFASPVNGWIQVGEAADRTYNHKTIYCNVYVKANMVDLPLNEDGELTSEEEYERVVNSYPRVDMLDEDEYSAGGSSTFSLVADKREYLELFCKDFGITKPIIENAVAQQTL